MGTRAGREPLSAADGAWWRMERPTNPMTITAVFTFAERVSYDALAALITGRLLAHPRFRRRVVDAGAGQAYWEEYPGLRLADHLVPVRLAPDAGQRELEALVSRLMSECLPADRPLWQLHFVEAYDGASALVVRLHHCLGDGVALVRLLLSLSEGAVTPAATAPPRGRPLTVRTAASAGLALARLLDLRADPPTEFQGALTHTKQVAWSAPVALDRVRQAGVAAGTTINDVLMSAVAGAFGRYLGARGDRVDGATLRAVVPVNLRPADDPGALGNQFGLVFLPLAIGEREPLARLRRTKAHMDRLKRSPEAAVVYGLLRALGRTTAGALAAAVRLLSRRASAVVTNVPGPRAPIRFAGAMVDALMFWVPQSGRIGLGVSVLSYAGQVRVGVAADAARVPDPAALVAAFEAALAETLAAVGVDAEVAPPAPAGAAAP